MTAGRRSAGEARTRHGDDSHHRQPPKAATTTNVFRGIDWATDHYDITPLDEAGTLLGQARIDAPVGLSQFLHLLAQHSDRPENRIPVVIEISHGLPDPTSIHRQRFGAGAGAWQFDG